MEQTTKKPDEKTFQLGPEGFIVQNKFLLATLDWKTIQDYVVNGLALPTNKSDFTQWMGPEALSDLSYFTELIQTFKDIHSHCATWKKKLSQLSWNWQVPFTNLE